MEKIYCELENCYGIPKFKNLFEFDTKKRGHLIYAPNGVMKSSFANTIKDIALERETKDFIYPNRITKRIVKHGSSSGEDVTKDEILVIEPYLESYESENIITLLANNELKKEFDKLHNDIETKTDYLFIQLSKLSGKKSAMNLFADDFNIDIKDINSSLEFIYDKYKQTGVKDLSHIKYGDIITVDSEKILKDKNLRKLLKEYIEEYDKLLKESYIFRTGFDHTNAENVLKTLGKDGFFKAEHQILLNSTEEAIGEKEFKDKILEEKKRILDEEIITKFDEIDKLLSSKVGTRKLRKFIRENKELIPELIEFDEFKKKLWLSYLFTTKDIFREVILNFKNNKVKIGNVIKKSKEQESAWHDVVKEFNYRFSNMPFELFITNKDDVVLKSEIPIISFKYKDRGEETDISENDLLLRLSNGEKKALYLLNVIFEIQARKNMGNKTLLIIDDIADSFDYRNKYAIIEYLKEIIDTDLFLPIILTHNFDFYRTVAGRLGIKGSSKFVISSEEEIELINGQYFGNVFKSWGEQVYRDDKIFLSSIAFVRNLTEYMFGNDFEIYENLTSLLHYKKFSKKGIKATKQIKVSDLINWYEFIWKKEIHKFQQDKKQTVYDLLFEETSKIIEENIDNQEIEYKIILSIAIRIKAEEYMIDRINDDEKIKKISGNQTRKLKDLIDFECTEEDENISSIIEKVLIITSENIHINSFMYEPIIDMSLRELKKLYNEVYGISLLAEAI